MTKIELNRRAHYKWGDFIRLFKRNGLSYKVTFFLMDNFEMLKDADNDKEQ